MRVERRSKWPQRAVTLATWLFLTAMAASTAQPVAASTPDSIEPGLEASENSATYRVERTGLDPSWRTVETENGWALPIDYLGWGSTLVASQDDSQFDLVAPHVPGHRLTSIEFTAALTPQIPEAHVIVSVDGQEELTVLVVGNEPVPLRFPLTGVAAGSVISIRVHPHQEDCPVGAEAILARLSSPTLFFRSAPVSQLSSNGTLLTPEVVAGIEFIVDDARSIAVEQAVATASASISHRYPGEQRFAVSAAGDDPTTPPPFVTAIQIVEQEEAGITGDTESGRFVVHGRSDALVNQAAGLVDALTSLREIHEVVVDDVTHLDRAPLDRRPIEEVTSSLRVSGAHHLELPILLEQADFGGPVASYRMRLGGVVSPTRSADATGIQLGLWVDDEILEVIEIDENGRFDLETVLAGPRIDRTAVVRLVLDLQIHGCPASDSLGIQLDRGSWIEPEQGQGLDAGFGRFPQVLGTAMAVDTGSSIGHLSIAADAIGLLQDTTTWLLEPHVTDRADIATAGPALVVGADIELLDLLGAPVNGPSGRVDTERSTLSASGDTASSVAQAFVSNHGHDILAIDSSGGDQPFGLPDALDVGRFRRLQGSVLHLDAAGLVEVAGVQISRGDENHEAALAPLGDHRAGALALDDSGLARRELFALGLALSMLVSGLVLFGRRSVRTAARAHSR